MNKRVCAYYSGRVQGVGFRFTVREIADELGIFGWVKNLADSRVEVVAEAEEPALSDFLSRIKSYFQRYIQDTDTEWLAATGEFKDFSINF